MLDTVRDYAIARLTARLGADGCMVRIRRKAGRSFLRTSSAHWTNMRLLASSSPNSQAPIAIDSSIDCTTQEIRSAARNGLPTTSSG